MSRQNHNANYIFDVEGETVWEKLRAIRSMLQEREISLAVNLLSIEEQFSKLEEGSFEYKKYLIMKPQQDQLLKETEEEIKFLKEYEQFLASEAEKTRIEGKTDEEMYEINFFDELKVKLARKAQAQVMSYGHVQDDLLLRIMKNGELLQLCISEGILSDQVLSVAYTKGLPSPNNTTANFIESQNLLTYRGEKNDD